MKMCSAPIQAAFRSCGVCPDLVARVTGGFVNSPGGESLSDTIFEAVNLRGMEDWASTWEDRQQDQLLQYIDCVRKFGIARGESDGVCFLRQDYRRKSGVGRAYCSWLSLHQCTHECRSGALRDPPWGVYELDQVNCQPRLLLKYLGVNFQFCGDNLQILFK